MADPDTTGKSPQKRASRKSPSSSSTDAVGAESRRKSTEALKPGSQLESEELQNVIGRGVVPPILNDPKRREEMGLPADEDSPGRYMIELNIQFRGGLREASKAFLKRCEEALGHEFVKDRPPVEISKSFYRVWLNVKQWRMLLKFDDDHAKTDPALRIIYKLCPDFKVKALMDRSVATVKADAAFRSYSATGSGITWAVIDSGIDGDHAHFGSIEDKERSVIHHPSVEELHRDFTEESENDAGPGAVAGSEEEQAEHGALVDGLGHGTHVAGIIAGGLPSDAIAYPESRRKRKIRYAVYEQVFDVDPQGHHVWGSKQPVQRKLRNPEAATRRRTQLYSGEPCSTSTARVT
jgi:subtilisin family serine protease